jgi:hypothetical protein
VRIAVHMFSVVRICFVLTLAKMADTASCLRRKRPWNSQHRPQQILRGSTGSKMILSAIQLVAMPTMKPKTGRTQEPV